MVTMVFLLVPIEGIFKVKMRSLVPVGNRSLSLSNGIYILGVS